MSDIFDMADTWNAGGTTFTAIKMNVTDTASAAASLLVDLLVNGATAFNISKTGIVTSSRFVADAAIVAATGVGLIGTKNTSGDFKFVSSFGLGGVQVGAALASDSAVGWDSTANATNGAQDLKLLRTGAAILGLRGADASTGATLSFLEQTAPAGAANEARLYAQDNGSGKTQLMVIMPTGAAIQLAIEP